MGAGIADAARVDGGGAPPSIASDATTSPEGTALLTPNTKKGWEVDAGFAMRVRPEHLGSGHYMVDPAPILEARYKDRVQLSFDDGFKWAALKGGGWSAGPLAEYRQAFADNLPRGSRRMDDAVELGGFLSKRVAIGEFEGRLRHTINSYGGWSGDFSFDTGGQITPNWRAGAEVRTNWADSRFTNQFFNLKARVAQSRGLPRFLENDYWTAGVETAAARKVSPHVEAVVSVSEDRILGEVGHTPLLKSRDIAQFKLGFVYHLASKRP